MYIWLYMYISQTSQPPPSSKAQRCRAGCPTLRPGVPCGGGRSPSDARPSRPGSSPAPSGKKKHPKMGEKSPWCAEELLNRTLARLRPTQNWFHRPKFWNFARKKHRGFEQPKLRISPRKMPGMQQARVSPEDKDPMLFQQQLRSNFSSSRFNTQKEELDSTQVISQPVDWWVLCLLFSCPYRSQNIHACRAFFNSAWWSQGRKKNTWCRKSIDKDE